MEANLLKMYQNGITKESMGESIALRAQVRSRLQKNRLANGWIQIITSCKSFSLIQSNMIEREQNQSLGLCERIGTGTEFLGPGGFHQAQQQMIIEVEKNVLACTRDMGPLSHVRCLYAFAKGFLDCVYWAS